MDSGEAAGQHDANRENVEAPLIKIETPVLKTEGAGTFDSYYARPETGRGPGLGPVVQPAGLWGGRGRTLAEPSGHLACGRWWGGFADGQPRFTTALATSLTSRRNPMKIVVLGAGIIGISTAIALAQEGHQVTLIERHPGPGEGTSYANGGMLHASQANPWNEPGVLGHALRMLGRR